MNIGEFKLVLSAIDKIANAIIDFIFVKDEDPNTDHNINDDRVNYKNLGFEDESSMSKEESSAVKIVVKVVRAAGFVIKFIHDILKLSVSLYNMVKCLKEFISGLDMNSKVRVARE